MSDIPEDLEQEPQSTSQSDVIYNLLKTMKRGELTPKKIKEIAKTKKVSTALVYKMRRKLDGEGFWKAKGIEPAPTPTPKEPIIRVKPEPEIEIVEEKEAEIPSEFAEPTTPREERIALEEKIEIGFKPEDLSYMLDLGFNKIADATDFEGWKLQPEESTRLGEIWTPIINKYLPQIIPYTPEIVACVTTVIIVAPRIYAWRQHKKEQEKAKEPEKPKQPESTVAKQIPSEEPKQPELTLEEKKQKEG